MDPDTLKYFEAINEAVKAVGVLATKDRAITAELLIFLVEKGVLTEADVDEVEARGLRAYGEAQALARNST